MPTILQYFGLLVLSLSIVIKSADYAIRYSTKLAESFRISKYIVGFIVVAIISILPETFISVTAAVNNVPAFGLGTLFGSNVADLTLVFALVIFFAGRSLKVESKIIKHRLVHVLIMCVPITFGLNGYYSRLEGVLLIILGLLFYLYILKRDGYAIEERRERFKIVNLLLLLASMGGLLLGAHFTVHYGVGLASILNINPAIIGMFVVGLGTTLPELLFSIRAAKHNHDGLALGDILGTVIADATIVVGIIAVISPFAFNQKIIYISGMFMLFGIILLFGLMKSEKAITKNEALMLALFYFLFVFAELVINQ